MQSADVVAAIGRDRVFYRQSGGGVTFSGGEPLAQAGFLRQVVEHCAAGGVSMVLETCGHWAWEGSADILARMDLIFLDLKHMDPEVHRRLTGVDNQLILENARRIAEQGMPLVIRVPFIPTLNDDAGNLAATAGFVRTLDVLGVEVLPYHTLGTGKYRALGLECRAGPLVPPDAAALAAAWAIFQDCGIEVLYLGSAP